MKKETRTAVYDDGLRIEAYHFEGIVQPFPNHFHEHYVIGFVEDGTRRLSCRNREYSIEKGSIVLFNPGDNHACVQSDDGTFDYRGFKSLPKSYWRISDRWKFCFSVLLWDLWRCLHSALSHGMWR